MKSNSELLIWFKKKYPKLVKAMKDTDHDYDLDNQNPYHLETDVFTHTLLALNQTKPHTDFNIRLAVLLHDIGKPLTRELYHEKKRTRFFSHEPVSAYLALDILNSPELNLSNQDKERIFKLICLHTECFKRDLIELKSEIDADLFWDLMDLANYDHGGRFHTDGTSSFNLNPIVMSKLPNIESETPREATTKKKVVIMVGTPLSGKSTYIAQNKAPEDIIISRDAIIDSLEGTNYNDKWNKADQKEVDKMLSEAFKSALKTNVGTIWVDTTAMSKKSRRRLLSYFNNEYRKECVVMLTPMDEIKVRQENRTEKYIDDSVIFDMIKRFYPPLVSEGFHSIKYIF